MFKVKLSYKVAYVGEPPTSKTTTLLVDADSFVDAGAKAVSQTEYQSGHYDVKAVCIEYMGETIVMEDK